jgi:hypothetical protein
MQLQLWNKTGSLYFSPEEEQQELRNSLSLQIPFATFEELISKLLYTEPSNPLSEPIGPPSVCLRLKCQSLDC